MYTYRKCKHLKHTRVTTTTFTSTVEDLFCFYLKFIQTESCSLYLASCSEHSMGNGKWIHSVAGSNNWSSHNFPLYTSIYVSFQVLMEIWFVLLMGLRTGLLWTSREHLSFDAHMYIFSHRGQILRSWSMLNFRIC